MQKYKIFFFLQPFGAIIFRKKSPAGVTIRRGFCAFVYLCICLFMKLRFIDILLGSAIIKRARHLTPFGSPVPGGQKHLGRMFVRLCARKKCRSLGAIGAFRFFHFSHKQVKRGASCSIFRAF